MRTLNQACYTPCNKASIAGDRTVGHAMIVSAPFEHRRDPRSVCRLAAGPSRQSQSGVALAISLVLLVAMTILGVATLSGTRLNEKITSNAQQKAVAFEVAESAIESVANDPQILMDAIRPDSGVATNDPDKITDAQRNLDISTRFDQIVGSVGTDVEGSVTIQYCGEGVPVGSSLSVDESGPATMVSYLIDVNGVAEIDNSATRADHLKRVSNTGPRSGLTGDCAPR